MASPKTDSSLAIARLPPFRFGPSIAQLFAPTDPLLRRQTFQEQLTGGYLAGGILPGGQPKLVDQLDQAGDDAESLEADLRSFVAGYLESTTLIEPGYDLAEVGASHALFQDPAGRAPDQIAGDGVSALQLALIFQLQLTGNRWHGGVDVADPGHHGRLAQRHGTPLGVGDGVLQGTDRQTLTDARSLVHPLVFPRLKCHSLDYLQHEVGKVEGPLSAASPGFLGGDLHPELDGSGVVRDHFGSDPVFKWGDDLASGRVVLRIRGEGQQDIQREADRVPFDLYVPFLHDVEQTHLDLPAEVGQLVDGEDSPIRPRQEPEVHGELVREQVTSPRGLDWIDIADQVGDRHVRGGELLDVALLPSKPGDGCGFPALCQQLSGILRDRGERIVVDLTPGDGRNPLVEQGGQLPQEPTLGLTPEPQQDEVVTRQERVDDLRQDGVLIPHNPGEERLSRFQPPKQVAPDLIPNGASPERSLRPAAVLQFPYGAWLDHAGVDLGACCG